ncbi:hypothetical protein [Pararhizobium sp.]|nr:hypothetical protein [Pararhizobium sp.]MDO9415078.1 hypothetical protein [Pararhizobium sp.]
MPDIILSMWKIPSIALVIAILVTACATDRHNCVVTPNETVECSGS